MSPEKIERVFVFTGLMFSLVIFFLEKFGIKGLSGETIDGILIAVLFSALNFRSWKILVGVILRRHTDMLKDTYNPQLGPSLMVISLKLIVVVIAINALFYRSREVRLGFIGGVCGYLLLGSIACILLNFYKPAVDKNNGAL